MELDVWIEQRLVGHLTYDGESNQFAFEYTSEWMTAPDAFPLTPTLPFAKPVSAEAHSRAVRIFFENLLPEGQALDDAALSYQVAKTNVAGLLAALGRETAGALRLLSPQSERPVAIVEPTDRRVLSRDELSERIRARPYQPFSVWDQKIRLSIAGFQDKVAVFQEAGNWYLVEGPDLASTHILKPDPVNPRMAGLTSNEFFCMRLAAAVKLPVAQVTLHRVPEPVLSIERFDRKIVAGRVQRLPAIDGCQALGLPVQRKYERDYGDGADVQDIRTGASLPKFFALCENAARPAAERLALLRWTIFQLLIGNTDAHAKNLTFMTGPNGLALAPGYDFVCCLLYADAHIADTYAMAIGDAFSPSDINAVEWASLCLATGLNPALVRKELNRLVAHTLAAIGSVRLAAIQQGALPEVVGSIEDVIRTEADRLLQLAPHIAFMARQEKTPR